MGAAPSILNHVHALGIRIPATTAAFSILSHVHDPGIAITGTAARGSPHEAGDTVSIENRSWHGWYGGAGRGVCREDYEKCLLNKPSLGAAMGEDGGEEMRYLIFSTHAWGLWS